MNVSLKNKKLSLARESLRRLNGAHLGQVHGGKLTIMTDCSSAAATHCPCAVETAYDASCTTCNTANC